MFNSWGPGGAGQRTLLRLDLEGAKRRKEEGQREEQPKRSTAALRWMTLLKGRGGGSPSMKSFLPGVRCACADFTCIHLTESLTFNSTRPGLSM